MQIRDKDKFRQQLFDNYFSRFSDYEDVHDPRLIDEALALLESHFGYTDEDKVMGKDRCCVASYLALRVAQELVGNR